MTKYRETTGSALEAKTILCNQGMRQGATGTVSVALDNSTAFVDQNQTSCTLIIPLSGLHTGDRISACRVVGALGAKSGGATVVDADLRKVTKGAGAVTDASIATASQVSVEADTALDAAITPSSEEKIATDYQYYVKVTITTADNAENDAAICGVEVDLNQSGGYGV